MKCKTIDLSLEEAIKFSNQNELLLVRRKNNMLLSDFQVKILNDYGFNYTNYSNYHDLLFDIENYLNTDYIPELDYISEQIAEFVYYQETKK